MTGDKLGLPQKIGRPDGPGPEPEVRDGDRPGLLGIIDVIALGEIVRLFPDDLDRIFVGPHCSVRTKAEENSAYHVLAFDVVCLCHMAEKDA